MDGVQVMVMTYFKEKNPIPFHSGMYTNRAWQMHERPCMSCCTPTAKQRCHVWSDCERAKQAQG